MPSTGFGRVYSFTTVWRPQLPEYETPYVVAVIELDEGWHMFSNIIGTAAESVHVGLRVRVAFRQMEGMTLPFFSPAER